MREILAPDLKCKIPPALFLHTLGILFGRGRLIVRLVMPTLFILISATAKGAPSNTRWDPAVLLLRAPACTVAASYSGASSELHAIFRGYRNTFSRVRGASCIYVPSCSRYSEEAVSRFGFFKGIIMTADRLERCNPCMSLAWYPRGAVNRDGRSLVIDPVDDHDYWHSEKVVMSTPAPHEDTEASKAGGVAQNGAHFPGNLGVGAQKSENTKLKTGWEKDVLSYCTDHSYHPDHSADGSVRIIKVR